MNSTRVFSGLLRRRLWTLLVVWIGSPPFAFAGTITVNTLVDENDGSSVNHVSLREAINQANTISGDATIVFSVTGTITLTADLPRINSNVTITGPGAGSLVVSGNDQYRIFFVNSGAVRIESLTLTHGRAAGGP